MKEGTIKQVYCCYHKADLDGKASGAIINYYSMNKLHIDSEDIIFIGCDYNYRFPIERIEDHEDNTIYMVDFSLPPDGMLQFNNMKSHFIWIDHHKSAIQDSVKFGYDHLPGVRAYEYSGCELTWKYLFKDVELPKAIRLLGRYDVWDYAHDSDVLPFQFGLRLYHTDPGNQFLWNPLLENDLTLVTKYVSEGMVVNKYRDIENRNIVNAAAYVVEFEGIHFLTINRAGVNSLLFKDYKKTRDNIDAYLTYYFDGVNKNWKFYMYQKPENYSKKVDILSVAIKRGGGGHPGACGFNSPTLPPELTA
jgi:oligoribonuclease NrnB/cAMP/cGMP phosphodiesterase (DHH superfamily)